MGVVGLEQDVVDGECVEHVARGVFLEPVTAVDLTGEILARLQLELGAMSPDLP